MKASYIVDGGGHLDIVTSDKIARVCSGETWQISPVAVRQYLRFTLSIDKVTCSKCKASMEYLALVVEERS